MLSSNKLLSISVAAFGVMALSSCITIEAPAGSNSRAVEARFPNTVKYLTYPDAQEIVCDDLKIDAPNAVFVFRNLDNNPSGDKIRFAKIDSSEIGKPDFIEVEPYQPTGLTFYRFATQKYTILTTKDASVYPKCYAKWADGTTKEFVPTEPHINGSRLKVTVTK